MVCAVPIMQQVLNWFPIRAVISNPSHQRGLRTSNPSMVMPCSSPLPKAPHCFLDLVWLQSQHLRPGPPLNPCSSQGTWRLGPFSPSSHLCLDLIECA